MDLINLRKRVSVWRFGRLYGISPDEAEEDRLLEQRRVDLVPQPRLNQVGRTVDTWNMFVNVLKLWSLWSRYFFALLTWTLYQDPQCLDNAGQEQSHQVRQANGTGSGRPFFVSRRDSDVWGLFWLDKMWIWFLHEFGQNLAKMFLSLF